MSPPSLTVNLKHDANNLQDVFPTLQKVDPTTTPKTRVGRFTTALRARMHPKWLQAFPLRSRFGRSAETGSDASSSDNSSEEEQEEEHDAEEESPPFLVLEGNFVNRSPWSRAFEFPESPIPEEQITEPYQDWTIPEVSIDAVIDEMYDLDRRRTASVAGDVNDITERAWRTHFRLVKNLSPGNQGQVDLYSMLPNQTPVIVKKIKPQGSARNIPKEVTINRSHLVNHPSIVNRYAIFFDDELRTFNIAMEFCSGGDLYDFAKYWLSERRTAIPEMFMLHFVASMGEALGWIHLGKTIGYHGALSLPEISCDSRQAPLLHRDIKLDNIFLRWGPSNRYGMPDIVLGDFGGATVEGAESDDVAFGTSDYWAPEVDEVMNAPYGWEQPWSLPVMTRASDMYTVGTTMYYMLEFHQRYRQGIDLTRYWTRSNLRNWPLLFDLTSRCLLYYPDDRPKTEELLNLAPPLRTHIRFLYEHGVRMPEDSWPSASRHESGNEIETAASSTFVEVVGHKDCCEPPDGMIELAADKSAQCSDDRWFDASSRLMESHRAFSESDTPPILKGTLATAPFSSSSEADSDMLQLSCSQAEQSPRDSLPSSPRLLLLYQKFGLAPHPPGSDESCGIPRYKEVVDISAPAPVGSPVPATDPVAPESPGFPSLRGFRAMDAANVSTRQPAREFSPFPSLRCFRVLERLAPLRFGISPGLNPIPREPEAFIGTLPRTSRSASSQARSYQALFDVHRLDRRSTRKGGIVGRQQCKSE